MQDTTRDALEALAQTPTDPTAFERAEDALLNERLWRELTQLFEDYAEAFSGHFRKYWQRLIERLENLAANLSPEELSLLYVAVGQTWENRLQRSDQAMIAYQRAFKVNPLNGRALDLARDIYARADNFEMVAKLWGLQLKVVTDPVRQVPMKTGLALVYYHHLGDPDAARSLAQDALATDPEYTEARRLLDVIDGRVSREVSTLEMLMHDLDGKTGAELAKAMITLANFIRDAEPEGAPDPDGLIEEARGNDPDSPEVREAYFDLLARRENWGALAQALRGTIQREVDRDRKLDFLLRLANVELELDEAQAMATLRQVLELDPLHPAALNQAARFYARTESWDDLIKVYEVAIKAAGRGEQSADLLAKTAEVYWLRLGDMAAAEKHFKKLKLMDARNPMMLRFYVARYREEENWSRLLSTLQSLRDVVEDPAEQVEYALEMGEIAEHKLNKASKAIDVWKWVLRHHPDHPKAREELHRLYTVGRKWNALLDLLKADVDALGADQVDEQVAAYREMIAIYRDHLKLDVMVINTYTALLKVKPGDLDALDALAERYAAAPRWNDYVGILEQRVEAVESVDDKLTILRQIADTWRTKLGNLSRAVDPLEQILALAPEDQEAIDQLKEIYTSRRDYKSLVEVQQKEIPLLAPEAQITALREMATVAQRRLKDDQLLASVYRQLLDVTDGADTEAAAELISLYDQGDQWEALASVLQRLHDGGHASHDQILRLADLYATHLTDLASAVEIWRGVLDAHADDYEARVRLTQAYTTTRDWDALEALAEAHGDVVATLDLYEISAQQTDDDEEAVALFGRVARICGAHTMPEREIAALESILGLRPKDDEVMAQLAARYRAQERFGELATLLERRLADAEGEAAGLLRLELAELYATALDEPVSAYNRYVEHFAIDPTDDDVRQHILDLATQLSRLDEWFEALKTISAQMPRGEARVANYRALGRLAAGPVASPTSAIDFFERVRSALPEDREALTALSELYAQTDQHAQLVDVLEDMKIVDPDEVPSLAMRQAELLSLYLGKPEEALNALNEVLEHDPESLPALRGLRRTYGAVGQWSDVVQTCTKELDLVAEDGRSEILHTLATTLNRELLDVHQALPHYAELLQRGDDPALRDDAISDLIALLDRDELRTQVADLLEPVLRSASRWEDVVTVLEARIRTGQDTLVHFKALAKVYDEGMEDNEAAYFTLGRSLLEVVPDAEVWQTMYRLADDLDMLADMATRWVAAADYHTPRVLDAQLPALATLQEQTLEDLDGARTTLGWVLDLHPEEQSALDQLERVLAGLEDLDALASLLISRAEDGSVDLRTARLREAAQLRQRDDRPDDAVQILREVLTFDPENMVVYEDLESLLRDNGRFEDLADHYTQWIEVAEPELKTRLHVRRGLLGRFQLDDPDMAIAALGEALRQSPGDTEAEDALRDMVANGDSPEVRQIALSTAVAIFVGQEAWETLVAWLPLRLQEAENDAARVGVLAATARMLEVELQRPQDAFEYLRQALSLSVLQAPVRESAERLAETLERWGDIVGLYEVALDDIDDTDTRFMLSVRLGEIYRDELADVVEAIGHFTTANQLHADDPAPLEALDELYAAAGRHDDRVAVLLRRAELVDEELGGQLRKEAARVVNGALADPDRAISVWESLRADMPGDEDTLEALTRLYTRQGRWAEAVDALQDHIGVTEVGSERDARRLRLAAMQEDQLEDLDAAIHTWEGLRADNHEDALVALDRLYGRTERSEEQAEVLRARLDAQEDAALRLRLAHLYAGPLGQGAEALECATMTLELEATREETLALLESLAEREETKDEALLLLEMAYEGASAWTDLVRVLTLRHERETGAARVTLLDRIVSLREEQLEDPVGALVAALEAYKLSEGEPERQAHVETLAERTESWGAYVMTCEALAQTGAPERKRDMHLRAAQIYADRLGDEDEAATHYRAMVAADATDLEALRPLDAYYTGEEDWAELIDVLDLEVAALDDVEERVAILHRLATVQSEALGEPDDARETLRRVWQLAPADRQAFERLLALHTAAEDWDGAGAVIAHYREHAEGSDAVRLDFQLAELERIHLEHPDKALDGYEAVLAVEPDHEGLEDALWAIFAEDPEGQTGIRAATALEPLLRASEARDRLLPVLQARAEWEATEDRTVRYDELVDLYLAEENHAAAFPALRHRLALDASSAERWALLMRVAPYVGDWDGVVQALEEGVVETEPPLRYQLSTFLAQVLSERLEDLERAQFVLEALLEETDAPSDEALALLERVLHQARAWDDLATFYRRRAEASEGDAVKAEFLEKVARIQENFVLDPTAAVAGYRALLEVRPGDQPAIQSVERILAEQEEWTELADFWSETAERIEGAERARMLSRLGELYLHELDEPAMSLGALRKALDEVPRYAAAMAALEAVLADARREEGGGMLGAEVAAILEPLYQPDVEWQKLIEVYEVQRAVADDPDEIVSLLSKLASIYEAHDDAAQAFSTWARALRVAPENATVGERLTALTETSGEWAQLRALYQSVIDDAPEVEVVSALRMRIAAIHERGEDEAAAERAIAVYREVLLEQENHLGASEALERLLRANGHWDELVEVLEARLHVLEDDVARRALHIKIAELQEAQLDNTDAAAETYRHLLGDDPDNTDALDALERLYADAEQWDDYIGILTHKVELVKSDEERRMLYAQIGETQAEQLQSPFEAIEAYRMVRELDADDMGAIFRLVQLYEQAEEWTELVEMLQEMRDRAEGGARVDAIVQIGRIRWRRMEDASGAISALADAVAEDPENDDAVELLEEMMADDDAALMAAAVLEPLFRAQENDEALVELLDRRASTTDSADLRYELFTEMAQIAETKLEDPDRAFEWFGHALMTRPGSTSALDALMRIGRATDRIWSAVEMLDTVLHECYDTDNIARLGLLAAHTRWKELEDLDGARDAYFAVLEQSGDRHEALVALEEILEALEDAEGLADVLGRRIANQDGDMAELQCRLAVVYEDDLDNPEQALSLFRDVLLDFPDHEPAVEGLMRLALMPDTSEDAADVLLPWLRERERWVELISVLQARLGELTDDDRVRALTEVAQTYERLDDPAAALPFYVSAFEADPNEPSRFAPVQRLAEANDQPHVVANAAFNVVDTLGDPAIAETVFLTGAAAAEQEDDLQRQEVLLRAFVELAPEHQDALESLEMLYRRKGDPEALLEVLGRKAELIYDMEEKATLLLQMAQTAEIELGDAEQARGFLDEVLLIDPRHMVAYDELIRIAEGQDDWATALEVLERKAEMLYGAEAIPVRMRIAEIAMIELDAPDTAIDAYQEVLRADPSHQEALYALSTAFREQEAWDDLHQILRQQLDTAGDAGARATLLSELSTLAEAELYDPDGAIEYQRQLVALEPSSASRERLEQLLRGTERWAEVLNVLQERLDAGDLGELEARVQMANIAIEELHDLVSAEEHLNAVLKQEPQHAHALSVLSRLYQEQGRWDEARSILEERLGATEDPSERVPLLGGLASLLEGELQDLDGAIERYEEAAALDPTHVATLDALERIYTTEGRWSALMGTLRKRVRLGDAETKVTRFLQIADVARDRLGDEAARLSALENAYSLDHENTTVAEQLLEAYIAAKRTQEARPILANLIAGLERGGRAAQRELYRYLHQKGDLAAAAGELDDALEAYTQAQKQNPSYVPNLVSLGRLHYQAERWDDALQVYQAALLNQLSIRDTAMKVDVFYHLGELRLKTDDVRRARDMFTRALRTEPGHALSEAGLKACDAAEGK